MTRLALRFAAFLLPFAALLPAPAAAQVLVQKPGDSQDWMVLAVMALGAEGDKARFEAAAKAEGYNPGRTKDSNDEDEVMMVVMPDANRAQFLQFYRDARAGKYGPLRFNIAITPWSAVTQKRNFIDEARVFPASAIPVPAE